MSIFVAKPNLPPLDEYLPFLEKIWDAAIVTNNGAFHRKLEEELALYLGVEHLSLVSNATLGLLVALKALNLAGKEVITTPYSFVATANVIVWANLKPVFVDVDPLTLNISPVSAERAITKDTAAILPVHVYGTPCDVLGFEELSARTGIPVIYDAAHAFGVKCGRSAVVSYGDISVLSFHATKLFTTIEGGALICKSAELKREVDLLRNFGFEDEVTVSRCGINTKMNELQAAIGLATLPNVGNVISYRKQIYELYQSRLSHLRCISFLDVDPDVTRNYSYLPIFISGPRSSTRDDLYESLKSHDIFSRRYFYPIITDFPFFAGQGEGLHHAKKAGSEVLCLPLHHGLTEVDVHRICDVITNFFESMS